MVCELPQKIKDAIERHKECFRTLRVEGTERERRGGGWTTYVDECEPGREALMKKAGARSIGSGVHRDVYGFQDSRHNECVVKVARSDGKEALDANRNEWKAWRSVSREARRSLMPVNDADPKGWWLTMELAEEAEDCGGGDGGHETWVTSTTKKTWVPQVGGQPGTWATVKTTGGGRARTGVYTWVEDEDGGDCGSSIQNDLADAGYHVDDVHSNNVGYWDGRNVLIDYGFGLEPRERGDGPRIRPIRTPVPRARRQRPGGFREFDVRRSRPRAPKPVVVYRTPDRGSGLQRTFTRDYA